MAITRLVIDGYGQVEPNQVTFTRTGRVAAQVKIGESFANVKVENGMLVLVDEVKKTIELDDGTNGPIGLVYTSETLYNQFAPGLKNFYNDPEGPGPRVGYLTVGEIFTTNTIAYDTTEFTNEEALITALKDIATTALFGGVEKTTGAIKITKTKPVKGPVLKVVKYTTMPSGVPGVKFQVI